MRVLGRNMAWMLKCIEAGRAAGINAPEMEPKVMTNVVREDLLGLSLIHIFAAEKKLHLLLGEAALGAHDHGDAGVGGRRAGREECIVHGFAQTRRLGRLFPAHEHGRRLAEHRGRLAHGDGLDDLRHPSLPLSLIHI